MTLATLKEVMVEIGGEFHHIALGVDEDGLVVGPYGKLVWAGSQLEIESRPPKGCTIHFRAPTGSTSDMFVPVASFGGAQSISMFTSWLRRCAEYAGAEVSAA